MKVYEKQLNEHYDYLIVGSGLFGASFARQMTDAGKKCIVIDRRPQLGGNVYCENVGGIDVHKYGAHIFHTENEKVWEFVNRYAKFLPYVHRVSARNGENTYSMPFNMYTFEQMWGVTTADSAKKIIEEQREGITDPQNLEEQAISLVGRELYETLVKHYTEKQWGRDCRSLPASIIKRLPLRFEYDDRYFTDAYQGIPEDGYNALIERLLDGIVAIPDMSYQKLISAFPDIADKIIYTGSIDGFFDYSLGHLEYRGLRFEEEDLPQEDFQGQAVVNYCDSENQFTRIIEHKYFTNKECNHTVITREYPQEWVPGREAYYPINDSRNEELYQKYLAMATEEAPNVIFGGRLGSYRYYDMDDAIAAALELAERESKISEDK